MVGDKAKQTGDHQDDPAVFRQRLLHNTGSLIFISIRRNRHLFIVWKDKMQEIRALGFPAFYLYLCSSNVQRETADYSVFSLKDDFSIYHGHIHLGMLDFDGLSGEQVAVNDHDVSQLAGLQGAELILCGLSVGGGSGISDQRLS